MHGVLVIDKPAGPTSAQVVAAVKRALTADRVGHTGTLDPQATGVLPVCLGEGTKLAPFLLADDKGYDGELELGVDTDTLDAAGRVTRRDPDGAGAVDAAALAGAFAGLTGRIEQVPPMFSALHHQGRRLHDLARAGVEVDRPARAIDVHTFALAAFTPPRATFHVECSKGTYVRSLVAEVGARLGCGAHLTALRRTRAGRFTLADAVALGGLDSERAAAALIGPAAALDHLPGWPVAAAQVRGIRDGKPLPWDELAAGPPPSGQFRLLTPGGDLLAVCALEGGRARALRVFTYGLTKTSDSFNLPPGKNP